MWFTLRDTPINLILWDNGNFSHSAWHSFGFLVWNNQWIDDTFFGRYDTFFVDWWIMMYFGLIDFTSLFWFLEISQSIWFINNCWPLMMVDSLILIPWSKRMAKCPKVVGSDNIFEMELLPNLVVSFWWPHLLWPLKFTWYPLLALNKLFFQPVPGWVSDITDPDGLYMKSTSVESLELFSWALVL